jgi:hypothetical protein
MATRVMSTVGRGNVQAQEYSRPENEVHLRSVRIESQKNLGPLIANSRIRPSIAPESPASTTTRASYTLIRSSRA